MKGTIQQYGKHTVAILEGEVDYYHLPAFKDFLRPLVEGDCQSLIISFKGVTFMDSSGIGLLVTSHKRMEKRGAFLALVDVTEDLLNLFRLGTIDRFLNIYNSLDDIPE